MTPRQEELVRHAIGLDHRKRSYRNRFFAGPGHADYEDWIDLVSKGLAAYRELKIEAGGSSVFYVTDDAAKAVLLKGESLDPEDFPSVGATP